MIFRVKRGCEFFIFALIVAMKLIVGTFDEVYSQRNE